MYSVYKVVYGDTLDSIAKMMNTTIDELMNINSNIDMNIGSYIVVPNNNSDLFQTYIVKPKDSLYQIAKEYGVNKDDLAAINGIKVDDFLYPNQQIMIPTKGTLVYVTKDGDTASLVVDNFNTDYNKLFSQNKSIYLNKDQLIIFKEENI